MNTVLITGCNRGIGLALVKHLVNMPNRPTHIIATCRNIQSAQELQKVQQQHENVHILELDIKDFDNYPNFVEEIEAIAKEDGLNLLVNNAGVHIKFTRIDLVKVEQLTETFLTNTVGPIMLTKALYPLLKKAAEKNASKPLGVSRAAVVNISSYLGSITYNNDGGLYPYRCAKAALNAASKSMSIDFIKDGILATSMHPGWVKTDMGGVNAHLNVDESVSEILETLQRLNEAHNGKFIQHDGTELPW